jgi:branched-chain amino acid aminotransferase
MSKIIFNERLISSNTPCIHHNDRGFTLGHGLFETILVNKGTIPALIYHWQRLETSAEMIGISLPCTMQKLEEMIGVVIKENNLHNKTAGARLTLTHGESERGLIPQKDPKPNFLITVFECIPSTDKPLKAMIVKTIKNERSVTSRIKSISYLDNILAKKEAIKYGYDEAILLNTTGKIADGSISNIFMVKNNQIITPPITDGALPGVVRAILLKELKEDFSFVEKTIDPDEFLLADEIFLTNALMGVKKVSKLNDREFSFSEITAKIQSALSIKLGITTYG